MHAPLSFFESLGLPESWSLIFGSVMLLYCVSVLLYGTYCLYVRLRGWLVATGTAAVGAVVQAKAQVTTTAANVAIVADRAAVAVLRAEDCLQRIGKSVESNTVVNTVTCVALSSTTLIGVATLIRYNVQQSATTDKLKRWVVPAGGLIAVGMALMNLANMPNAVRQYSSVSRWLTFATSLLVGATIVGDWLGADASEAKELVSEMKKVPAGGIGFVPHKVFVKRTTNSGLDNSPYHLVDGTDGIPVPSEWLNSDDVFDGEISIDTWSTVIIYGFTKKVVLTNPFRMKGNVLATRVFDPRFALFVDAILDQRITVDDWPSDEKMLSKAIENNPTFWEKAYVSFYLHKELYGYNPTVTWDCFALQYLPSCTVTMHDNPISDEKQSLSSYSFSFSKEWADIQQKYISSIKPSEECVKARTLYETLRDPFKHAMSFIKDNKIACGAATVATLSIVTVVVWYCVRRRDHPESFSGIDVEEGTNKRQRMREFLNNLKHYANLKGRRYQLEGSRGEKLYVTPDFDTDEYLNTRRDADVVGRWRVKELEDGVESRIAEAEAFDRVVGGYWDVRHGARPTRQQNEDLREAYSRIGLDPHSNLTKSDEWRLDSMRRKIEREREAKAVPKPIHLPPSTGRKGRVPRVVLNTSDLFESAAPSANPKRRSLVAKKECYDGPNCSRLHHFIATPPNTSESYADASHHCAAYSHYKPPEGVGVPIVSEDVAESKSFAGPFLRHKNGLVIDVVHAATGQRLQSAFRVGNSIFTCWHGALEGNVPIALRLLVPGVETRVFVPGETHAIEKNSTHNVVAVGKFYQRGTDDIGIASCNVSSDLIPGFSLGKFNPERTYEIAYRLPEGDTLRDCTYLCHDIARDTHPRWGEVLTYKTQSTDGVSGSPVYDVESGALIGLHVGENKSLLSKVQIAIYLSAPIHSRLEAYEKRSTFAGDYEVNLHSAPPIYANNLPQHLGTVDSNPIRHLEPKRCPHFQQYLDETKATWPDDDWIMTDPDPESVYMDVAKYGQLLPALDTDAKDAFLKAVNYVNCMFEPYLAGTGFATHEEALSAMNLDATNGFNLNQTAKTCKEWIEMYSARGPALWDAFLEGRMKWTYVGTAFGKKEIRSVAKVKQRKIRSIVTLNRDLLYIQMRVFLHFSEALHKVPMKTWSALGMCPFYGWWNTVFSRHSEPTKGFDQKQCDSRQRNETCIAFYLLRYCCLPAECQTAIIKMALLDLADATMSTLIIVNRHVYLKEHGTLTGEFVTADRNTYGSAVGFAFSFFYAKPECAEDDLEKIAVSCYGDDSLVSMPTELWKKYGHNVFENGFARLGMYLEPEIPDPGPVDKLAFLSMYGKRVSKGVVPIPRASKVLAAARWVKGDFVGLDVLAGKVNALSVLLYHTSEYTHVLDLKRWVAAKGNYSWVSSSDIEKLYHGEESVGSELSNTMPYIDDVFDQTRGYEGEGHSIFVPRNHAERKNSLFAPDNERLDDRSIGSHVKILHAGELQTHQFCVDVEAQLLGYHGIRFGCNCRTECFDHDTGFPICDACEDHPCEWHDENELLQRVRRGNWFVGKRHWLDEPHPYATMSIDDRGVPYNIRWFDDSFVRHLLFILDLRDDADPQPEDSQEFNPTLGHPGEGPPKMSLNKPNKEMSGNSVKSVVYGGEQSQTPLHECSACTSGSRGTGHQRAHEFMMMNFPSFQLGGCGCAQCAIEVKNPSHTSPETVEELMLDWDNQKKVADDLTAAWQFIMKEGPTCQYPWGCVHTKTAILMAGKCQRRCPGTAGTKRQAKGDGPPKVDIDGHDHGEAVNGKPWWHPVAAPVRYLEHSEGVAPTLAGRVAQGSTILNAGRRFVNAATRAVSGVEDKLSARRFRPRGDSDNVPIIPVRTGRQHAERIGYTEALDDPVVYDTLVGGTRGRPFPKVWTDPIAPGRPGDKRQSKGDGPKKPSAVKKATVKRVAKQEAKREFKKEIKKFVPRAKAKKGRVKRGKQPVSYNVQPDSVVPFQKIPGARGMRTAVKSMAKVVGSEYVCQIACATGYASALDANGITLPYIDINPYAISTTGKLVKQIDTRLVKYAAMYEQFRLRVKFTYVRRIDTTKAGDLVWFFDKDSADSENWCFGDQRILQVAKNHLFSKIFPVSTMTEQAMTIRTGWLWTRLKQTTTAVTDIRKVSGGRFYCINAEANAIDGGSGMGKLMVDYEVEFRYPTLGEDYFNTSTTVAIGDQTATESLILSLNAGTVTNNLTSPNVQFATGASASRVFHSLTNHADTATEPSAGGFKIGTTNIVPHHQFVRVNLSWPITFSAAVTVPLLRMSLYDQDGNDAITTSVATSNLSSAFYADFLASDSKSTRAVACCDIYIAPMEGPYTMDLYWRWTTAVNTSSSSVAVHIMPSTYVPDLWSGTLFKSKNDWMTEFDVDDCKTDDLAEHTEQELAIKRGILAGYLTKLTRAERRVEKKNDFSAK